MIKISKRINRVVTGGKRYTHIQQRQGTDLAAAVVVQPVHRASIKQYPHNTILYLMYDNIVIKNVTGKSMIK